MRIGVGVRVDVSVSVSMCVCVRMGGWILIYISRGSRKSWLGLWMRDGRSV